jgi:SAM-dependent methyltransferase
MGMSVLCQAPSKGIIKVNNQNIPYQYGNSFESERRIRPRIWDSAYCLLHGLADTIKKIVLEYVKPGMKVIDFGCGAKPYRSLFPENCDYIGIDATSNAYADIVIEPGQPAPLPDSSVDFILSTQVVYLIPEYSDYLNECRRLLRLDGVLLITTHGTWTYHPASGGDYYRFTQDGLRHILTKAGFEIETIIPVVGTLGTGLHLRQLVFNAWLNRIPLGGLLANLFNIFTNCRIMLEDKFSPIGTRMSSPVIFAALARPLKNQND